VTPRALYDLEVYSDHFEALEIARAEVQGELIEAAALEHSDEEALDRLEWQRDERDAALEQFKREERASDPWLRVRPLRAPRAKPSTPKRRAA
jgi:hypothetical protein